jgi:SAM-dependent methyltransferase
MSVENAAQENTSRFGDRVDNYVKYRPSYPDEVINFLRKNFDLASSHIVVDIGSGTGISSEMFLKNGNRVIGIEPNTPMRERSLSLLKSYNRFEVIDGTAESTGLQDASADFVVAGQAFHWFDRDRAKAEFQRIVKGNGVVVLMWNERLVDTEFGQLYDQLIIDHAIDYITVDHRNIDPNTVAEFFSPNSCTMKSFANRQVFDFEGLKGRLTSSSYVPNEGQPGYAPMVEALKQLFQQYRQGDRITINYSTNVYVSKFEPAS